MEEWNLSVVEVGATGYDATNCCYFRTLDFARLLSEIEFLWSELYSRVM
jgi:hypothetical protein